MQQLKVQLRGFMLCQIPCKVLVVRTAAHSLSYAYRVTKVCDRSVCSYKKYEPFVSMGVGVRRVRKARFLAVLSLDESFGLETYNPQSRDGCLRGASQYAPHVAGGHSAYISAEHKADSGEFSQIFLNKRQAVSAFRQTETFTEGSQLKIGGSSKVTGHPGSELSCSQQLRLLGRQPYSPLLQV